MRIWRTVHATTAARLPPPPPPAVRALRPNCIYWRSSAPHQARRAACTRRLPRGLTTLRRCRPRPHCLRHASSVCWRTRRLGGCAARRACSALVWMLPWLRQQAALLRGAARGQRRRERQGRCVQRAWRTGRVVLTRQTPYISSESGHERFKALRRRGGRERPRAAPVPSVSHAALHVAPALRRPAQRRAAARNTALRSRDGTRCAASPCPVLRLPVAPLCARPLSVRCGPSCC